MFTLGLILAVMSVLLSWLHSRYAWGTSRLDRPVWMDLSGQRMLAFAASLLGWLACAVLWWAAGFKWGAAALAVKWAFCAISLPLYFVVRLSRELRYFAHAGAADNPAASWRSNAGLLLGFYLFCDDHWFLGFKPLALTALFCGWFPRSRW